MNHPNEKMMNGQNMFTNKYLQKMVILMKTKVLYCDGDS